MALTARGWWTSACGLISLAFGVAIGSPFLAILGLVVLGIVFATWLLMSGALWELRKSIKVRAHWSETGPLRVGRPSKIILCIDGLNHPVSSLLRLDPAPIGRFLKSGSKPIAWNPEPNGRWIGNYCPIPSHIGRAGIFGLCFGLHDPAGWFIHRGFLSARLERPVLAAVLAPRLRHKSARKETNVLARSGLFFHEKPGQSMEFLGLRDFQSGDSTRRVSWKASLRRERILVRETEWEVPAVIQILVDSGNYNRAENSDSKTVAFDEMAVLSGHIFRQVLDHGNPTGLTLVSEKDLLLESPGLGPAHMLRMELAFAEMANGPVCVDPGQAALIALWADEILCRIYPELMDPAKNNLPFWYSWIEGFPANPFNSSGKSPAFSERLDGFRFWFWLAGPIGWLMMPFVFSLTDRKRRIGLARKRVAASLAGLIPLAPGALERMIQDDVFFANTTVEALTQLGIHSVLPGFQQCVVEPAMQIDQGRRLAKSLLGRLAFARDRQAFIVILCASRIPFGLGPLLEAIKRCVAKGHRVLVWDLNSREVIGESVGSIKNRVTRDLTVALTRSGVGYWHGSREEILAQWEILVRKEGFLGRKRKC